MVRINLLPIKEKLKRKAIVEHAIALLVCLLLVIAVMGIHYGYLMGQKIVIEKEIASTKTEIEKISTVVKEIEGFKKQTKDLQQKLGVIKSLKTGGTSYVEILDQVSILIPEKAWLSSLSNNGSTVDIDGFATDTPTIAEFMKRLQDSLYFSDVSLIFTQQEKENHKFVITCKIRTS